MNVVHHGGAPIAPRDAFEVRGQLVEREGRDWYEIRHYDRMPPFFISLLSSDDHWWFVSSTGGMTMGRRDADHALLPYETEDKITRNVVHTGSLTIARVRDAEGRRHLWEPLTLRTPRVYRLERRLRKSIEGDALCFEEFNRDLGLRYTMTLRSGPELGFIRTVCFANEADAAVDFEVLDGYRGVLPHGASQVLQTRLSCLLDAYKRNELDEATGVAFYSLSSTLTDRAEASEALRANVVWSNGLDPSVVLLTPDERVDAFRRGEPITGDRDVRGLVGAYLGLTSFEAMPRAERRWHLVADVAYDAKSAGRVRLWQRDLDERAREAKVVNDTGANVRALRRIVGSADGLSLTGEPLTTAHHFANALFNVMRGGVFKRGHEVAGVDFASFVRTRNRPVHARCLAWLSELPDRLPIGDLLERAGATEDVDLRRLSLEYLPLVFSRRHGDPSRPWNQFAIRLRNADGSPRTDYQGNWRDIFQNWEPLAYSFPAFAFSMVAKFLNATTPDGYNPYRVTRDGIDWEVPEPDDPWANLGYWGDHQIIYLQKLLEAVERTEPGRLVREWSYRGYSYADVPYRIATYDAMTRDASNTITFDAAAHARSMGRVDAMGSDGRLVPSGTGEGEEVEVGVYHVTMFEKLLVLLLAKLTNLVPGGGIWMNTQRPEWNDANNALVGKGVSVVTAAYLRRFVCFWRDQLNGVATDATFEVGEGIAAGAQSITEILETHRATLATPMSDESRRCVMDQLGAAGTQLRAAQYQGPAAPIEMSVARVATLLDLALVYLDHALSESRCQDGLYHGYRVLAWTDEGVGLRALVPMLEGQVAVLSSGHLSPDEALGVLQALRRSPLYWPEQRTYLLYPNRILPGFLEKNRFSAQRLQESRLAAALTEAGDERLVVIDPYDGDAHFGGDLHNAEGLGALLDTLGEEERYSDLVDAERQQYLDLFEDVFNHASFTGRSGTFFAYEGLGSVYWHMVSKLLLAVQECHRDAVERGASPETQAGLREAYSDIREGLGFRKSPRRYGAFPTDPYSHTPETGGARQPGMTGQVKEELLTRMGELGVRIRGGAIQFESAVVAPSERLGAPGRFDFFDVHAEERRVPVPALGLAFTLAQTPIIYEPLGDTFELRLELADGTARTFEGDTLPPEFSRHLLSRDGEISLIRVYSRKVSAS